MRALLDSNFLIALVDSEHLFHTRAHSWWTDNADYGWASCPLTENACLRILSQPKYAPGARYSVIELRTWFRNFIENTDHEFWPDNLSFLSNGLYDFDKVHGAKQLTDIYLLSLAVKNKGRLVTFDTRIARSAVHNAKPANLCTA